MKKTIMTAGVLALLGAPSFSFAKSININPVQAGMNTSYLGLEDAALADQPFSSKQTPDRVNFYSTYHWNKEPWIRVSADGKSEIEPVVSGLHSLHLGMSWLLNRETQLSFDTFFSVVGVAERFGADNTPHMGDSRLQLKYRFLTGDYWTMAIAPEFTIPTGVEYVGHRYGASLSNSSFSPGLKLISEYRTTENQWAFNLGYNYYSQAEFKFPNSSYPQFDGRSRTFLGAGWLHRFTEKVALDAEFSTQLVAGHNHFSPPGLLTLGARLQPSDSISWHFGAGTGSFGATGANDVVVFAGIKVPLFNSPIGETTDSSETFQHVEDYSDNDPLLKEAYRKNRRYQNEKTSNKGSDLNLDY